MTFNVQKVAVGDAMPVLQLAPISRTTLALFAGASGDHNPIHIDIDFAQKAGMKDVFAHGMLSMAYLARALAEWVPQQRILRYGVRFAAITPAICATASTSPLGTPPDWMRASVSLFMTMRPRAVASRTVSSFAETSTIFARPCASMCESLGACVRFAAKSSS